MSVATTETDLSILPASTPCEIDRLPTELFLVIFQICVTKTAQEFEAEVDPPDGRRTKFVFNFDALVISHVNGRWRTMSRDAPSLWSHIYVIIPLRTRRETGSSVESLVSLYLQLSKNLSLDIALILPEIQDSILHIPGDIKSFPILPLFLQQAHRWRSATIRLHKSSALAKLQDIFPNTLPVLEELDLRYLPHWQQLFDTRDTLFILPSFKAPLLRKLSMKRFFRSETFPCSLNEISLAFVDTNTVVSFLADASAQCRANISTMFRPNNEYGPTHATSSLRSLSFTSTGDNYDNFNPLDAVLGRLTLPNVEELFFTEKNPYEMGWRFPTYALLSLLDRSSSCLTKLTRLHIVGHDITADNLLDILEKLQSLTDLMIKEPFMSYELADLGPLTDHFFHHLIGSLQLPGYPIAPNLLRVEFDLRSDTSLRKEMEIAFAACVLFLQSRRPARRVSGSDGDIIELSTAALQTAKIYLGPNAEGSETSEVLSQLRADGLVVEIVDNARYDPPWRKKRV